MATILLVAGLTLLASFFCSISEAALYSVSVGQAEALAAERRPGAHKLAQLRASIGEPISALLTVNTIANTAGAALFGSLVAETYGDGGHALALGTGLLTLSILLVAEIVPKSLGVRYAGRVAPLVAWPLQIMVWLAWPVVKAAGVLIRMLTGSGGDSAPSEDEIVIMARLAASGGTMRSQEHRWVKNALALDRVQVRDIMTPRTVVRFLPQDTRLDALDPKDNIWSHSRVPITEGGSLEGIRGIVYRKHVLDALLSGETDGVLADLVRPVEFVPETMRGHVLLDKLLSDKVHLAVVLDEFGGVEGIVTLEDVVESLLGAEIVDEHDEVTDMQVLAREQAARSAAERGKGAL